MTGASAPLDVALATLASKDRYKLMIGLVIPRPIALVSSRGTAGIDNCAPFSFFNVLSEDPPLVIVSVETRKDGSPKDTARNIRETGVFCVNLVDEAIADPMYVCSLDYPPEQSEAPAAGLTLVPCTDIPCPRILEAPASLECRLFRTVDVGTQRLLAIGEVMRIHAREGIVDPATHRVNAAAYHPVGRLYGNLYTRQHDRFTLPTGTPEAETLHVKGRKPAAAAE